MTRAPAPILAALVAMAAMAAMAACAAPADVAPAVVVAPPRVAPPPSPRIDPDPSSPARIAADVRELASPAFGGRGTGEPGARLAADLVARRFAELGLAPRGEAGAPSPYFQRFEARTGVHADPPSIAVTLDGRATSVDAAAAIAADGSASGRVTAPVAFVGYGIRAPALGTDDWAGVDAKGKVAVMLEGSPATFTDAFGSARYKIREAREHGAVGVVLVVPEPLPLPPASADAADMGLPAVVVEARAIAPLLERAGYVRVRNAKSTKPRLPGANVVRGASITLATKLAPVTAEAWNVLASLPAREGSPTAGEWVVVGAHYDHLGHGGTSASRAPGSREVHPGADDNASGTALLLEVARRLAAMPVRPSRGVLFASFGAEELGAVGSRHLVEHMPVPLDAVVAMLNADMVGRLRDRRLVVDGTSTSAAWPDLIASANAGLGLDLALGGEGFGASDHVAFTAAKIPVAFFFTGVHDDYHRPSDTADRIEVEGEASIALLAARLAVAVAERRDRLDFASPHADPHHGGAMGGGGLRASFGTLPDYAWTGRGMRLSGVRPDAPAERAGLRAGDVIVKVGPHDIGTIYDFMYALGELEPGRAVDVIVERAGARVTVSVVPAPGK
jgi:hypothetical protein